MIDLRLPAGPLRILCLGAHPDDVEIGVGATLLTLARRGEVTADVVVLSGSGDRYHEAMRSTARFLPDCTVSTTVVGLPDGRLPAHWEQVKQALEDAAAGTPAPDVVFAPRTDDAHQDHRLLGELATTTWRDQLVLHYEIPKWDGDFGRATHYVAIDSSTAERKVDLLDQCFPSQHDRDWWDPELFFGLMRLRGMESRSRYAESFVVAKALLAL